MTNKISVLIDVAVDGANRGIKSFRESIADADGTVGKFKAGAASALQSVKANAGEFAVAAGAALVAFGVKSVNAFQDLAIEAGKLADALGMPVEDASRLIEVAGDVGIEVSALESTIGRMNRVAASTPKAFADIGAAIAKNKDGTTNVNETFLNTVDALNRIPDATKRAEAAQKIFGRSWMDIAELVGQGSDDIRKSLDQVSDAKVIDESEVAKARRFRAAMDDLADAAEDATLIIGEALVPAVAALAETASDVKSSFAGWTIPPAVSSTLGKIAEHGARIVFWPKLVLDYSDAWKSVVGPIDVVQDALDDLEKQQNLNLAATNASNLVNEAATAIVEGVTGATEENTSALEESARLHNQVTATTEANVRALDAKKAALDREKQALEDVRNATIAQFSSDIAYQRQVQSTSAAIDAAKNSTDAYSGEVLTAKDAMLGQAAAAVQLASDQAAANGKTLTSKQSTEIYKAELGKLAESLAPGSPLRNALWEYMVALASIPKSINTSIGATLAKQGIHADPAKQYGGGRASGGPTTAGSMHEVLEGGKSELLTEGGKTFLMAARDGQVTPLGSALQQAGGASNGGGGTTINLTVYAGFGSDGPGIARTINNELRALYRSGEPRP